MSFCPRSLLRILFSCHERVCLLLDEELMEANQGTPANSHKQGFYAHWCVHRREFRQDPRTPQLSQPKLLTHTIMS